MISTFVITDCMKKKRKKKRALNRVGTCIWPTFWDNNNTPQPNVLPVFSLFGGYLVKNRYIIEHVLTRDECIVVKLLFDHVGQ